MDFLLKLLGAKKRMKIQGGKLWEITRLWGFDLRKIEREPAKPEPFIPPERGSRGCGCTTSSSTTTTTT